MFKLVDQPPRYRLVAQQIAEHILKGELEPGARLPPDRELVDSFGVSRATVREALIALEISGFVTSSFGSSMRVASAPPRRNTLDRLSGPGPFELLEARLIVEGEIAALATEHITAAEIAELRTLTSRMLSEGEDKFWGNNADERFHLTIAAATRNSALEGVVAEFWRQRMKQPMWVQMHSRVRTAPMKEALVKEHYRIVDALESGNQQAARSAMHRHISGFGEQLLIAWNDLDENARQSVSGPTEDLASKIKAELEEATTASAAGEP